MFAKGHRAVEAGAVAHMTARSALHVHAEPDAVLIVVDSELDHALNEAAGGALMPKLLPAPTPIDGFAELDRLGERLRVHVGVHQDFPARVIRGDDRDMT